MNAFNPIATMQRLEGAGIKRQHAEALADELHSATTELVTKEELTKALDAQANRLTLRIVGTLGALIVGSSAVLGVILSALFH